MPLNPAPTNDPSARQQIASKKHLFSPSKCLGITVLWAVLMSACQADDTIQQESPLRLNDLRRMVLEQNDQIQMRLQDAEVSERLHRAEKGIFEPQLVGGAEYFDTSRPNNRQQSAQLGFFARPFYLERNTLYNAGIEFLLGTGAKLRTGYMLRDLNNNVGAAETTPGQLMGRKRAVNPMVPNLF
jgi:hypothetical protein